jgi:hypothetical protein
MKEHKKVKWYPVPEFKLEGEEIPHFKVKMATLDDQIQSRHLSEHPTRLLASVLKKVMKGEKVDVKSLREDIYRDVHPKTLLTCFIFQRCVLNPKFNIDQVIELSETHPDLVNNVATFALGVKEGEEKNGN